MITIVNPVLTTKTKSAMQPEVCNFQQKVFISYGPNLLGVLWHFYLISLTNTKHLPFCKSRYKLLIRFVINFSSFSISMRNTPISVPITGQQRKAIKPTRVTIPPLRHKGAGQDSPWICCCYLSPPLEPLA